MFYSIVVMDNPSADEDHPLVLAFLFPHQRVAHGRIQDFLVSVDVLEAMTGLDFLSELDDETEDWLEDQDTWAFWEQHFAGDGS